MSNSVRVGSDLDRALSTVAGLATHNNATRYLYAYGDGFWSCDVQPDDLGWIKVDPFETVERLKRRWDIRPVPYIGDTMPKWVADGAVVKVKSTTETRFKRGRGLSTSAGCHTNDNAAFAGEIGIIEMSRGNGWWCWRVGFSRGRWITLDKSTLDVLVRVMKNGGVAATLAAAEEQAGALATGVFSWHGVSWSREKLTGVDDQVREFFVAVLRDDKDKPGGMFAGVYVSIATSEIRVVLDTGEDITHTDYPAKTGLAVLRDVLIMTRVAARARQVILVPEAA